MKKFTLLALLLIGTHCFAKELHSFNRIKEASITGKTLHFVIHFAKCSVPESAFARRMTIGVLTPESLSVGDHHISASMRHFTLNNHVFPDRAVYEFVTYTLGDDDNLTLTGNILDAVTYTPLTEIFSMTCQLDRGVKVYV